MQSKTFSYVRSVYGRNAGRCLVTRFFKIGNLGDVSFIEKRVPNNKEQLPVQYKMGTLKYVNTSTIFASNKKEYNQNLKIAIERIF
jgi:hypothetical protein